jgi:hypothetical protein
MSERNFVTFAGESVRRNFSACDGSSVAMIVTSAAVGFPKWALSLAREFCDREKLFIPDTPDGWNIHAEYFSGKHRMFIFLEDIVIARARMTLESRE